MRHRLNSHPPAAVPPPVRPTVTVLHLTACVFLYIGTFGQPAWMDRGVEYGATREDGVWDNYLLSFYFVSSSLRTVGNVDELTPSTFQEVVYSLVLMLVTMVFFSYVLGEISAMIMQSDDAVAEARARQATVENYIESRKGISNYLAEEIRAHTRSTAENGQKWALSEIYQLISHSLQVRPGYLTPPPPPQ